MFRFGRNCGPMFKSNELGESIYIELRCEMMAYDFVTLEMY